MSRYFTTVPTAIHRLGRTIFVMALGVAVAMIAACAGSDSAERVSEAESLSSYQVVIEDAPRFSLGSGGGSSSIEFFQISSAVVLEGGGVAVADGVPRLLVLDETGSLQQTVGQRGEGPEEFRRIAWIQEVSRDALMAYDPSTGRASIFTVGGEHLGSVSAQAPPDAVDHQLAGVFADGSILGQSRSLAAGPAGGSGLVRPSLVLTRHRPDGQLIETVGQVPGDELAIVEGVVLRIPVARRTFVAVHAQEFYVASGEDFRVSVFGSDGASIREVVWSHDPEPVTAEDLPTLPAGVEVPLPPTLPAISGLLVDDLGFVWIEPFVRSSDEPIPWVVFAPDGSFATTVSMPEAFRPLHISEDRMVGVWRDSLDVEHLRLYGIARSGPGGT